MPRSIIASLPEAPGSTLVQPLEWVSKRSNDAFRQRVEVTHCRADRCSAARWIGKRLADEMLVGAPSDRDDLARAARGFKRALAGTAVTSSNGHYQSCIDSVVESHRQQIVVAMITAAQRQVENIHSVLDCLINCIQDVFTASVQHATGENIVIAQPRARSDARHVIDLHAVHNSSFAGYSSRYASRVCAVILNGLGVQTLVVGLIIENFRNNNLFRDVVAVLILVMRSAVSRIALGKSLGIAKAGWIEERMRLVDTLVDVADLDAGAGSGSAASGSPGIRRVDDFVALAQS